MTSVGSLPSSGARPSSLGSGGVMAGPPSQPSGHGGHDRVAQALQRAEGVVHGGGFVPTMDHAVLALLVSALAPVVLPARGLHQLAEAVGIALLEQVARTLPAEDVVGGIAPRRALEVPLAHEELQKQ